MCILIQDGNTALHKAAWEGHTETVDCLVSAGADVNVANKVRKPIAMLYLTNVLFCKYRKVTNM